MSALAGADIQTNPPATNKAISESDVTFSNQVSEPMDAALLEEIDLKVDFGKLEDVLMAEGLRKFSDPQQALLNQITEKRGMLTAR
ncbi:MAG: transaldolase family protein [Pirellulaceae bacterium]|nr:transaldolase family protein [Pirellulaceae bacterium]HJN11531.1 hypothetical protein [Pirellulaceae bacterium]